MRQRILLCALLSVICLLNCHAASWDYLKKELYSRNSNTILINDTVRVPIYSSTPSGVRYYNGQTFQDEYKLIGYRNLNIPAPIYEEYRIGRNCYKTGAVFISIGSIMAFAGGICYLASSDRNQSAKTAGEVLFIMGDCFITVSIPLLCFGDHMKRDANWKYRLHK